MCGLEQLGKTPWLKENIAVFPEHGRTFFGAQMKYGELSLSFRDYSYVLGKVAVLGGK